MDGSDRRSVPASRLLGALVIAALGTTATACAPAIPLQDRGCPCLEAQGYRCCARTLLCYRVDDMPAACAPDGTGGGAGAAPPDTRDDRAAVDGFLPPPPALLETGPWLYTTRQPPPDWMRPEFEAAGWETGHPGFFGAGDAPAPGDRQRTPWPEAAGDLWLRTTFQIEGPDVSRALLWGRWDDEIEVYLNGALTAVGAFTAGYRYVGLDASALVPGAPNTLAVRATNHGGGRYVDLAIALNGALTNLPTSGSERTPSLAVYGNAVRRVMHRHGIPGGVLAVMKRDEVVVSRAFGWADKHFTRPMSPDAVFRLSTQEVILTAGAIAMLIDGGVQDPVTGERITRDTRIFPLLRAHGLLPPPGHTPAPQLDEVTVGMLLAFEGGLSELSGDPSQLHADLGLAPDTPISAADNVRWIYGAPPARRPGPPAGDGESGYMLLRHLIDVVTGDLLSFVRTAVFAPAGSSDVFIAHEPLARRDPREPGYLTLEAPFERSIYLESFHALATTAEAFVRYLRRYHAAYGSLLVDPETQRWAAVPDNGTHVLFGVVPGLWTVVEQRRHDEVSFALFFNIAGPYDEIFGELERITDGLPESAWGL